MRRILGIVLSSVLFGTVLATAFVAGIVVAPDVAAVEDCDPVVRPSEEFVARSGGREVTLTLDLDANTLESVQAQRLVAFFQLNTLGYSAEAIQQVSDYFDSLLSWYAFLARPCAEALPYTGPYTNVPEIASAPFGFGGIEATPGRAFVMEFSDVADEASQNVDVLADAAAVDDGPALAHSGSESFVLAYFGAGLLAFGATALGMRRWMSGPIER